MFDPPKDTILWHEPRLETVFALVCLPLMTFGSACLARLYGSNNHFLASSISRNSLIF